MKPVVSVIIPFLNEAANIKSLVEKLNNYSNKTTDFSLEIIFVNDGSRDESVSILLSLEHKYHKGKLISLSKNYGSHAALRAGISDATGDFVTFMYADLQDPLSLIDELYARCERGFDIVWAVRNEIKNNLFEKLFSRTYSSLMKKYAIDSYPEKGFDIVFFTRKIQKSINQSIEANSSIFLQILSLGFRQSSISYNKEARRNGKSKWTVRKKIKLFIDSFISFSYAPIRLVSLMGLAIFSIGLLWSVYIIARKVLYDDLETGWPTIISILLLGFGITNMSLGIIAEYLWRTLDSSRKRPVFLIDEVIDLN